MKFLRLFALPVLRRTKRLPFVLPSVFSDPKSLAEWARNLDFIQPKKKDVVPIGDLPDVADVPDVKKYVGVLGLYAKVGICESKGRRARMEDRVSFERFRHVQVGAAQTDVDVFCVFDGHGGAEVADTLQSEFTDLFGGQLRERLALLDGREDVATFTSHLLDAYKASIRQTFVELDRQLIAYTRCGSTAVIVTRLGKLLVTANVGDSCGMVARQGSAELLSVTHTLKDPVERDRIGYSNLYSRPGGSALCVKGELAIPRAFGDNLYKDRGRKLVISDPDFTVFNMEKDVDGSTFSEEAFYLVLTCDGITDALSYRQMADVCTKGYDVDDIANGLVGLAFHGVENNDKPSSSDNMTAMVVEYINFPYTNQVIPFGYNERGFEAVFGNFELPYFGGGDS